MRLLTGKYVTTTMGGSSLVMALALPAVYSTPLDVPLWLWALILGLLMSDITLTLKRPLYMRSTPPRDLRVLRSINTMPRFVQSYRQFEEAVIGFGDTREDTTMNNILPAIHGKMKEMDCCGVNEYIGINKPKWTATCFFKVMMDNKQWKYAPFGDPKCAGHAAYVLTAVVQDNDKKDAPGYANVRKLKKYVTQYKLGTLVESGYAPSGKYQATHLINTLVFVPDRDVLIPFAQKRGWLPKLDKNRVHAPGTGGVMWGKNAPIIA